MPIVRENHDSELLKACYQATSFLISRQIPTLNNVTFPSYIEASGNPNQAKKRFVKLIKGFMDEMIKEHERRYINRNGNPIPLDQGKLIEFAPAYREQLLRPDGVLTQEFDALYNSSGLSAMRQSRSSTSRSTTQSRLARGGTRKKKNKKV
jgi:hypothetical protein